MQFTEREQYWRQIVAQQKQSGLSVKAFCRQENLCPHTLYLWRRRLAAKPAVNFAVVNVKPAAHSAVLELIVGSGERLQIPAGCDAATLRTVIGILRERA